MIIKGGGKNLMKDKLFFYRLLFILMTIFLMIACSDSTKKTESDASIDQKNDISYSIDDFNSTKTNLDDPINGGEITVALVSSSPFEGILNYLYQTAAIDSSILSWFNEGLLEQDENFDYTQDGAATFEISDDNLVWTITIRDEVYWHDGYPVIAEDLKLAFEILGHPEYDGPWFGTNEENIVGMKEYRAGKADSISGIKVINEKTIEINFLEANPFTFIWNSPIPKHIFGDMDITEISSSPEVREHPIGFGPFKVDHIVPGESVVLTKFKEYWRGEPNLDQVTLKVVDPANVVQEIKTGGVDISSFPTDRYPENEHLSNVEFLTEISNSYSFIGFRLGDRKHSTSEVVTDLENSKMGDIRLRRAMWHAIDTELINQKFYHGLTRRGTTLVPPYHRHYHDESNPGLAYDPDLANQLLDEAGYEWCEGEKYRRDPNGNELEITFLSYEGDDTVEPMIRYFIQAWGDIGLNVQLLDGRLHEFNTYFDMLVEPNNDFDIYIATLGVGTVPDPSIFKGPRSMYNYARYQSEASNHLLEKASSEAAFDRDYLKNVLYEWQALMVEEVPEFPIIYGTTMMAINNRIVNYSLDPAEKIYRYELGVSQDKPFIDGE